jgi:hypothetical protein
MKYCFEVDNYKHGGGAKVWGYIRQSWNDKPSSVNKFVVNNPIIHDTLRPQKLALTSPTSGGLSVGVVRSRTKATEFSLV